MWCDKSGYKRSGMYGSLPYGGPCLDLEVESFGCDVIVEDFLEKNDVRGE